MAADDNTLGLMLDDLSLGLVMVDPDDLISMGEVLQKIENIAEVAAESGAGEKYAILKGLQKALEAIILDQVRDRQQTMDAVSQGISLLLDMERNQSSGGLDLEGFVGTLKDASGVEIDLSGEMPFVEKVEAAPRTEAPPSPAAPQEEGGYDASRTRTSFSAS